MIVSHKYGFIYLKTEKTGSTSLERALSEIIAPDDFWPQGPRPAWGRVFPGLHGGATRQLPELFGLHAHATAAQVRRVFGRDIWDRYYKFSIERNPWDRQVSLYTHRQWKRGRGPEHFARDMASAVYRNTEFCRLNNWGIYAIGGKIAVDRVLRHEHLETDLASLCADLGLPKLTLGRHRAYGPARPHYSSYYDAAARDLVARWYGREISAFDYAFEDRAGLCAITEAIS